MVIMEIIAYVALTNDENNAIYGSCFGIKSNRMKQKTIKGRYYTMNVQKKLSQRIQRLCKNQGISFYTLSYKAAVPMTTLMHIINCSTKNPGIFTIIKICNGLNMTIKDFFDTKEFIDIEYETE